MVMDIEDRTVEMEIDTGAGVSVMNEIFSKLRRGGHKLELQSSNCRLSTYTGQKIIPLGHCTVNVKYENCEDKLPLVIIPGSGATLLGQSWLDIRVDWKQIFYLRTATRRGPASTAQTLSSGPDATSAPVDGLKDILDTYPGVFKDELDTLKGNTAKLDVDPNAKLVFCKAGPVPFALRDRLDKELDRLEQSGIIAPIQFAEWAAPIVPVVKSNQSIILSGDYKMTVNRCSTLDPYPIPRRRGDSSAFARTSAVSAKSRSVIQTSEPHSAVFYSTSSQLHGPYKRCRVFGQEHIPDAF